MTPEAWYILAMGMVILIAIATSHWSLLAEFRGETGSLHREMEKLIERIDQFEASLTERIDRFEASLTARLSRLEIAVGESLARVERAIRLPGSTIDRGTE